MCELAKGRSDQKNTCFSLFSQRAHPENVLLGRWEEKVGREGGREGEGYV